MASVVSIKITGPVFSALFLDHVNITGDQEGFLLGEVSTRKVDIISDAQINNEKEEINIDITSVVPCADTHEFYNNYGEISENSLNDILGNNIKNVIGWYRFRRNSNLEALVLERTIHQKLASLLAKHRQQLFAFGIFTSAMSVNMSTHSFDYAFLHLVNRKFEHLAMSIVNLGDTSHSEYKTYPQVTVNTYLKKCGVTQEKSHALGKQHFSIDSIQGIQSSIQSNLQLLHQQVKESENSIRAMIKDVAELSKKLLMKQTSTERERPQTEGETLSKLSPLEQTGSPADSPSSPACVTDEIATNPFWTINSKPFTPASENPPDAFSGHKQQQEQQ